MTTKLSSRGQLVIPKRIRAKLWLKSGATLHVAEKDGTIVLSPVAERRVVALPRRNPRTRLPQFDLPRGLPKLGEHFVRDALAEFP